MYKITVCKTSVSYGEVEIDTDDSLRAYEESVDKAPTLTFSDEKVVYGVSEIHRV